MDTSTQLMTGLLTAALLGTFAMPAQAATSQETTTSLALVGGSLSITVQDTAALGSTAAGAGSVSGNLGSVTVNDARGAAVPWSAFASATAFTGPGSSESTGVSYSTGLITATGVSVIVPRSPASLSATAVKVAGPTSVVGNNTATWNPVVTVSLPSSALAGTYTGTITTSVS